MFQEELEETKTKLSSESLRTSKFSIDKTLQSQLDKALENLKDLQEHNTVLQLQLDSLNNSHQTLKACNEELTTTNKTLERKLIENEALITRLKNELKSLQDKYTILVDSEKLLKKSIEHEKLQNKTSKSQNEKDAKCIQDLQRQVKEMERIITRKHPDSVSALILAANTNIDSNLSARKILEDRIKQLETEAHDRDLHSTKIFADVQEKFNDMKRKYESHIDDLEKHVLDLKSQLNTNIEMCDVETQTFLDTNKNVHFVEVAVQTLMNKIPIPQLATKKQRVANLTNKEDAHLLATIRGLNADILSKDRILVKLQKDMDELRKTNRRLQKEREGSLKSNSQYNPNEYRYDNTFHADNQQDMDNLNIQMDNVRDEKEKLKMQLARLEEDYQMLKLKRLQDLNTLQEAHEQELTNYMGKMAPLREQLEVQQVTIKKLQQQLTSAREQIAVLTVERDHLEQRLKTVRHASSTREDDFDGNNSSSGITTTRSEYDILRRKITLLEQRYEERELRLRAIVQGLAQKQQSTQSARDCEQCMLRQQQLCNYKAELDQVLSTLRNHTNL